MVTVSNSASLDSTDWAIINEVEIDGRISYSVLANKLGVSPGTIANRIQKMVDARILSFIGVVHPFNMGLYALALIGLRADPRRVDEIAKQLATYSSVRFVVACTGAFEIIIEVVERSNEDLLRFITEELSTIDGVYEVKVSNEMKLYKNAFNFREGANK